MSNETKNEPKSLAEMTKKELLQEICIQARMGKGVALPDIKLWELRADLLRRMEAGETAERKLQEQAEAVREIVEAADDVRDELYPQDVCSTCEHHYCAGKRNAYEQINRAAERLKALQPTPEGGTK